MQGGFARAVGISLFAEGRNPRHRADIDDSRRVRRRAGLAQQRQELLDAVEDRGHVQLHDLFPALHRIAFQWRAPGGAGVVDEDIQPIDPLAQACRQRQHTFLGRQVGGQGLAMAQGAEFIGGLLAGFGVPGTHVDVGAGFDKGLGDHLADAAGTAGDQRGAALQGKVGVHGES